MCKLFNKYFQVLHFKFHFIITLLSSVTVRLPQPLPCFINPYLQV